MSYDAIRPLVRALALAVRMAPSLKKYDEVKAALAAIEANGWTP